uniref:CCHC-type domain-containing protein n=1 Tax=Gopherus agassizii TaxID=38772 RepID=A0A452I932_9SAUR
RAATLGRRGFPVTGSARDVCSLWWLALGHILEKIMWAYATSNACRKLILFLGEEEFEPWLEHTTEMLREWAVPDVEKRRCLIESLSGPALDVVRTLKLIDPGVSVKDCLEALDNTFGSVEGPEVSYCTFLNSRQQSSEKISAYIQRLEKHTTEELAQQTQVLTEWIAELQSTIDRAKISRNKAPQTVTMEKSVSRVTIPSQRRGKGEFFCYRCGQDGHSAANCHKEENPSLLILFLGEEEFEPWLEHTTEMLREWAVPDVEKRRCLIESLSGPALDVVRTLKLIDPGVSVKDCLEALDNTFGSVEGPEVSYCTFLNSRQQSSEKISAYIQRLEKQL